MSDKEPAAARAERREEFRQRCRRWLWRHPHRAVNRAFAWYIWKGVPPWHLTATQWAFIDPRPLDRYALAGLRAMTEELDREDAPVTDEECGG